MNIFIEATGSLTSGYLIKAIKEAGHRSIGSDISEFNHGKILCDDFIIMPKINDKNLWEKTLKLLVKHNVEVVIPSLDETMVDWASRILFFEKKRIKIIISPISTIQIFQDKWNTFQFFSKINILTPKTSLDSKYEIIKPRLGRGGTGIIDRKSVV